jgi:hypothetical protein
MTALSDVEPAIWRMDGAQIDGNVVWVTKKPLPSEVARQKRERERMFSTATNQPASLPLASPLRRNIVSVACCYVM